MSSVNPQAIHDLSGQHQREIKPRPSRAGAKNNGDSKPGAGVAFRQVSFGFWRAETKTHRLEIRLVSGHGPSNNKQYAGTLTRRGSLEEVATYKTGLYPACQRKLIDAMTFDCEQEARRPGNIRAICQFEEFDGDGVEKLLLRRRDVYLKRWGLQAMSERFSTNKVDGRSTRVLTVVTEQITPATTSATPPATEAAP